MNQPFFMHFRDAERKKSNQKKVKCNGITVAAVIQNNCLYFGMSYCSNKDNFQKSIGRKIAEERAIKTPNFILSIENIEKIGSVFVEKAKYLVCQ